MRKPMMRWVFTAMLIGALVGAGEALAQRRWLVSGMLEDVDEDTHSIQVSGNTLQVGAYTRIEAAGGRPASWDDIVEWDGDSVTALVVPGEPFDVIETIRLEVPEQED